MASSQVASGDLIVGRKGRISRAHGRGKSLSDRWAAAPARVAKKEGVEAGRLLEHREKMIRVTLADRKFESVFQPIVELKSGGVVGAEALTRFDMSAGLLP